jgi:hypothetical protein
LPYFVIVPVVDAVTGVQSPTAEFPNGSVALTK